VTRAFGFTVPEVLAALRKFAAASIHKELPAIESSDAGRLQPGDQFRLGLYYVSVLGLTPKGRHVHFEILAPRRRKNQAPRRGWLPVRRFVRDAVPCGRFERAPSGDLVWIEPIRREAA